MAVDALAAFGSGEGGGTGRILGRGRGGFSPVGASLVSVAPFTVFDRVRLLTGTTLAGRVGLPERFRVTFFLGGIVEVLVSWLGEN